jgi:hypothetical protein
MPRAVKLSGSAKVGGTLKVVGRSWGDDVKMQYRWTCDHETFKLTSKASLKLGPDQVGCRVSVAVRGYAPGKASAVRVTNHPEVVGLAMALATPQIGIASETGLVAVATVKAGTVLTATFAPDGDYPGFAVAWEWLRDGVPIPGQTGSTYAASWDDEGRTLSARGTATADGYESATGVTSGVGVQKATAPAVPPGEVHRPRG